MEVRRGAYEEAYKRLRKPLLVSRNSDSPVGLALLAVAARETGHEKEERRATELAVDQGVDLSVLDGPGSSPAPAPPQG